MMTKFYQNLIVLLIFGIFNESVSYRLDVQENENRREGCGQSNVEVYWLASLYTREMYEHLTATTTTSTLKPTTVSTPSTLSQNSTTVNSFTLSSIATSSLGETINIPSNDDVSSTTLSSGNVTDRSTTDKSNVTMRMTTEIPMPKEVTTEIPFQSSSQSTNGVFISQHHLLTASSFFIEWSDSSRWTWKSTNSPVDNSICGQQRNASYRTTNVDVFVQDFKGKWRNVVEIEFLSFCEFQDSQEGFLTLITTAIPENSAPVPLVCLAKKNLKNEKERLQFFTWTGNAKVLESVQKCQLESNADFYTSGSSCLSSRGAPMIRKDQFGVDRIIGIGALENRQQRKEFRFHVVHQYLEEICETAGICNKAVGKIGLVPGKNDDKNRNIVDDDYVEQEPEPEILDFTDGSWRSNTEYFWVVLVTFWFLV